jgi:hypothetical protein
MAHALSLYCSHLPSHPKFKFFSKWLRFKLTTPYTCSRIFSSGNPLYALKIRATARTVLLVFQEKLGGGSIYLGNKVLLLEQRTNRLNEKGEGAGAQNNNGKILNYIAQGIKQMASKIKCDKT